MLLVALKDINQNELVNKYPGKINYIALPEEVVDAAVISFLEQTRESTLKYDVTIIMYFPGLIPCLNTLQLDFTLLYNSLDSESEQILDTACERVDISNIDIEKLLAEQFDWVQLEVVTPEVAAPQASGLLTLEELLNDNVSISEADVRELNAVQNKFKVALLLQAKSRLKTILKLCNTLDKLYEELLDRVDKSLATTDTASLMYTTEYISKALADTNQFIMSLINNDKIQNFFIIDNSSVININNDRIDINRREKIRKAVEIVMNNLDFFEQNQFDQLENPNTVEVSGDIVDADNES